MPEGPEDFELEGRDRLLNVAAVSLHSVFPKQLLFGGHGIRPQRNLLELGGASRGERDSWREATPQQARCCWGPHRRAGVYRQLGVGGKQILKPMQIRTRTQTQYHAIRRQRSTGNAACSRQRRSPKTRYAQNVITAIIFIKIYLFGFYSKRGDSFEGK